MLGRKCLRRGRGVGTLPPAVTAQASHRRVSGARAGIVFLAPLSV
ncbi:MAG: hypothetical protein OXG81_15250 [Acidobacteria bacterium]|nr:hypothetical protein [Acidobacteriota bacterium]